MSTKRRKDSKLWTLPPPVQAHLFELCRGKGGYAEARAWLLAEHQLTVKSDATFSKWFSRYPFSLSANVSFAQDFEQELKKLPKLQGDAEQISQLGQIGFEALAMRSQDLKGFAIVRQDRREENRLRLEREKFEHAKKADWEKGLDALFAEIKGNAEAEKHFAAMKAALKKAAK